jgi:hypothetical protein
VDDFDFGGLIEGAGELLGSLVEMVTFNSMLPDGDTVSTATAMSATPLTPEQKRTLQKTPFLPGFEEGTKYRVKANEWWADVTVDDVLVVNISTSTHVIFNRPEGEILSVPNGMIDDFERIENGLQKDSSGPS